MFRAAASFVDSVNCGQQIQASNCMKLDQLNAANRLHQLLELTSSSALHLGPELHEALLCHQTLQASLSV